MPDLTEHLRAARADLLRRIDVPELGQVRSRARTIRRRRRAVQAAGSALALMVVVGAVSAIVRDSAGGRPAPVGSAQPTVTVPEQSVWRGGGLTLNGLDGQIIDLPGDLVDVQFADADQAYALATDCPADGGACGIALAVSRDGGHSWQPWDSPVVQAPANGIPRLLTVGTSGVALLSSPTGYYSPSDRPEWTELPEPSTVVERVSAAARLTLRPAGQPQRCDGPAVLTVLQPDGTTAELQQPPDMRVCRVAPVRGADGSMWVGGDAGAVPALAVSRDDGATWTVKPLPATAGASWAQVATVGSEVYATVVAPRSDGTTLTIEAVYRATTADLDFQPYAGRIGTVTGELIPVLDGRLVAAGPNWYVSQQPGETMQAAGGTLPWVGRIQRSPGGWVAYNLFDAGWVATSLDGTTWQKINLR